MRKPSSQNPVTTAPNVSESGILARIRQVETTFNRTRKEFSDALSIPYSTVVAQLDGKHALGIKLMVRVLERYPEVDGNWLLSGEGIMLKPGASAPFIPPEESVLVPILGEAPPGTPLERALANHAEDHVRMDPAGVVVPGDTLFAVRMADDSMMGMHILPGDLAVCSLVQDVEDGHLVAVYQASSGEATVKQLGSWDRKTGRALLIPFNVGLAPFSVRLGAGDQVRRVVAVVRRLPVRAR